MEMESAIDYPSPAELLETCGISALDYSKRSFACRKDK